MTHLRINLKTISVNLGPGFDIVNHFSPVMCYVFSCVQSLVATFHFAIVQYTHWPLTLKSFSATPTHMLNICATFCWNLKSVHHVQRYCVIRNTGWTRKVQRYCGIRNTGWAQKSNHLWPML